MKRCTAEESGGGRCEKREGHDGSHACPRLVEVWLRTRDITRAESEVNVQLAPLFAPDDPDDDDFADDIIPF